MTPVLNLEVFRWENPHSRQIAQALFVRKDTVRRKLLIESTLQRSETESSAGELKANDPRESNHHT